MSANKPRTHYVGHGWKGPIDVWPGDKVVHCDGHWLDIQGYCHGCGAPLLVVEHEMFGCTLKEVKGAEVYGFVG